MSTFPPKGGDLFCLSEMRYKIDANNNHNSKVNDFPEAHASWNTRYVDPNDFKCYITLRGKTGTEQLEKVTNAINCLLKNAYNPYLYRIPQ